MQILLAFFLTFRDCRGMMGEIKAKGMTEHETVGAGHRLGGNVYEYLVLSAEEAENGDYLSILRLTAVCHSLYAAGRHAGRYTERLGNSKSAGLQQSGAHKGREAHMAVGIRRGVPAGVYLLLFVVWGERKPEELDIGSIAGNRHACHNCQLPLYRGGDDPPAGGGQLAAVADLQCIQFFHRRHLLRGAEPALHPDGGHPLGQREKGIRRKRAVLSLEQFSKLEAALFRA